MKLSYSLLLPAMALCISFATPHQLRAFGGPPGGPFSNGSYFSNNGTFSAVLRGENLTGTLQFSTTDGAGAPVQLAIEDPETGQITLQDTNSGQGSTGTATIYYDGDTFLGNSQGALNSESSTMSINFQADSQGQGQQEFEQVNATVNRNPGYTLQVSYFDSLYLNGAANCKTSNAFPNQKFEGSGEVELQYLNFFDDTLGYPLLESVSVPISITGVRISNTTSTFFVSAVRPPSVNHYTTEFP